MSIEGLWTIVFSGKFGAGAGVVVFETGRIFGGDTSMYYIGDYEVNNGSLSGNIRVRIHAQVPGMRPVTGIDDFTAILTAAKVGETMQVMCDVTEPPGTGLKIQAKLHKIAELP